MVISNGKGTPFFLCLYAYISKTMNNVSTKQGNAHRGQKRGQNNTVAQQEVKPYNVARECLKQIEAEKEREAQAIASNSPTPTPTPSEPQRLNDAQERAMQTVTLGDESRKLLIAIGKIDDAMTIVSDVIRAYWGEDAEDYIMEHTTTKICEARASIFKQLNEVMYANLSNMSPTTI